MKFFTRLLKLAGALEINKFNPFISHIRKPRFRDTSVIDSMSQSTGKGFEN